MDIITHALIGRAISLSKKETRRSIYFAVFFSLLADLISLPLYLYIGFINNRLFWIPLNSDWDGFRDLHPFLSALYDIPHSVFFLLIVILPLVLFFKLPKISFWAYGAHLFLDLFSHYGEWALKPFYPLGYKFEGFTNGWSWSIQSMAILWISIIIIIIVSKKLLSYKSKKI
ncbi:MAG: hypothetical protein PHI53_00675 [Candidatus Pacebacteria bacterium]|nr:hypothetical protein [Candidatus Paceibacterota bacterium]